MLPGVNNDAMLDAKLDATLDAMLADTLAHTFVTDWRLETWEHVGTHAYTVCSVILL